MDITLSPLMIYSAIAIGSISAYLAYKRERNPYLWFAIGFLFGIFGIFALFFAAPKRRRKTQLAVVEPVFLIQGPSDKFWYYLDENTQQQGPVSLEGVRTAWKDGKISLSTYVWHEELPEWQPLKKNIKRITKKL